MTAPQHHGPWPARSTARWLRAVGLGLGLGLLAGVAACAGRGRAVEAPVELAIAPIGSAPNGGIVTNGERSSGDGRCSVQVLPARIEKSSPGCYLDEHISKGIGLLYYPCSGDGPAEAEFGSQRYTGRLSGGEVELELASELDWEDGCRWGTKAVITGTLVSSKGEPVLRPLAWRYRDHVVTGTSCSGVCTAKATLQVTRTNGGAPAWRVDQDEDDEDSD
jgi:hypothetical protein